MIVMFHFYHITIMQISADVQMWLNMLPSRSETLRSSMFLEAWHLGTPRTLGTLRPLGTLGTPRTLGTPWHLVRSDTRCTPRGRTRSSRAERRNLRPDGRRAIDLPWCESGVHLDPATKNLRSWNLRSWNGQSFQPVRAIPGASARTSLTAAMDCSARWNSGARFYVPQRGSSRANLLRGRPFDARPDGHRAVGRTIVVCHRSSPHHNPEQHQPTQPSSRCADRCGVPAVERSVGQNEPQRLIPDHAHTVLQAEALETYTIHRHQCRQQSDGGCRESNNGCDGPR